MPAHLDNLLQPKALAPEVFISYARRDHELVQRITDQFSAMNVSFWLDHQVIDGGANFAAAIAHGIKQSRLFVLMCSDAALRSRNVSKEIILAWKYARPYLPLLLERVSFPEQIEFFLEGIQWIEIFDYPVSRWLPRLERALALAGVATAAHPTGSSTSVPTAFAKQETPSLPSPQTRVDLSSLRALAGFNDCLWPIAAEHLPTGHRLRATFRGIGAPQKEAHHEYKIGSRLGVAIYAQRAGYLLLIDQGPDGIIYCLCPSWFAPDAMIEQGMNYLPQTNARYDAFEVSGEPGREYLLAIITDQPFGFDWMPSDSHSPARVLNSQDAELLVAELRQRDPASWVALATFFHVVR